MANAQIELSPMCKTHVSLLVHGAGFAPEDPWRALIVAAHVALFQAACADPATYERIGGDVTRAGELGCLGCYKPDAFGEIVEVARTTRDIGAVKRLGESWCVPRT